MRPRKSAVATGDDALTQVLAASSPPSARRERLAVERPVFWKLER